ncbi:MAG: UDP-glucose 4-epimerase GalE, partial [Bacteroidales bacterium]|nr:UDP-glucose 4-epimerase GalE [Bacteroidales bacterium]
MKRILLTGGSGYIGSHTLIELIKSREFEVISDDNYSRSAPGTMVTIEAVFGASVVNYEVDL